MRTDSQGDPLDPRIFERLMNEESLFAEALAKRADERAAFLDAYCQGDIELRRRVEALLEAADHPDPFLQAPASLAKPTSDAPAPQGPGTMIGPYKLLEQIGEGGMGTVWMAQQTEPVKRVVALKLIKAGMDSKQVIARFEAERQALALMDHPSIAKVLDAGATGEPEAQARAGAEPLARASGFGFGHPYFVMELVKGVPITRYCDEHHLTPRQRLELFLPVCQAVQHAHQKGIIHRDLKPSNILVALYDDKPVPKVIDFGVAKATGQPLTEQTLVTGFGAIIGTLEYMSPEQAEINQLDIDTRSDIYSLGVLLYELLTGSPPFSRKEVETVGVLETLRLIREEEPPKPSTRLSTAEGLPTLAANRGTEPARLTKLVRGELDWIVMKALDKDRDRRYETANGFAMDVQRYLADEPVLACPPSAGYRFRKLVRRNKGPALAASLVFLTLVGGVIGTTWGLVRAEHARQREEDQRRAADANADRAVKAQERAEQGFAKAKEAVEHFLNAVTDDPDLKHKHDLHPLRKKLLEAAVPFYQWFTEQKPGEANLEARGWAYDRLARVRTELGDRKSARTDYERMQASFAQLTTDFPTVPEYRLGLAMSHHNLGILLAGVKGQLPAVEQALRRALDIYEELAADFPTVPKYRQELARSHNAMGFLLKDLGQRPAAEKALRRALKLREKLAGDFPTEPHYRFEFAESHSCLGLLLDDLGQRPAAEQAYRQALDIQEKLAADFPTLPDYRAALASTHSNLGVLLRDSGQQAAAEQAHRRAVEIREMLAAAFPTVPDYRAALAASQINLGIVLQDLRQRPAAEQAYRRALDIQEKLVADFPTHPGYRRQQAANYVNFGGLVGDQASLAWFAKAIALLEPLVRQEPRLVMERLFLRNAHWNRARALDRLGRHADAVGDWDRTLALNADAEQEFGMRYSRARSLARAGEHVKAVAEADVLAEMKDLSGNQLYSLAVVCACAAAAVTDDAQIQDRYAARAVELLRRAAAKGFTGAAHISKHKDLEALRDRQDFERLVTELKAQKK